MKDSHASTEKFFGDSGPQDAASAALRRSGSTVERNKKALFCPLRRIPLSLSNQTLTLKPDVLTSESRFNSPVTDTFCRGLSDKKCHFESPSATQAIDRVCKLLKSK
jgi:hypothetical protein